MIEYGLIAVADQVIATSYCDAAREEGLEAVRSASAEQARGILAQRGLPRIVMAHVDKSNANSLPILREVQRASHGSARSLVLAAVARELRTTVGDLRESLGIVELLPQRAGQQALRHAIRRALSIRVAPITDLCPPPTPGDDPQGDDLPGLAGFEEMDLLEHLAPEQQLHDLTARTAEALDVPVVVVCLTIDSQEWAYAHVKPGEYRSDLRDPARVSAFCEHVVTEGQPVSVLDARLHPAFSAHPLIGAGVVISFAGAPFVSSDGDVLGALCILDSKPISRISARLDLLTRIAVRFVSELEGRSKARSVALEVVRLNDKLSASQVELRRTKDRLACLETLLSNLEDGVILMNARREILHLNDAARAMLGSSREAAGQLTGDDVARALAGQIVETGDDLDQKRELVFAPPPFCADLYLDLPRPRTVRWKAKSVALPTGAGELFVLAEVRGPLDGSTSQAEPAVQAHAGGLRSTRVVKKRR